MRVAKALADGRAAVNQCSGFYGKNQVLRPMLQTIILPFAAENIFVMVDFNDACFWKMR